MLLIHLQSLDNHQSLNTGQWRRKCGVNLISKSQLQENKNSACVIPLWSLELKKVLYLGLISFNDIIFGNKKSFYIPRVGSNLFNPRIIKEKKEIFKMFSIMLKRGIITVFLLV